MRRLKSLWAEQHGVVSIYLILILIPLFLACGLLIDIVRWKNAERETENAVKAGVRSTLSAFSTPLQSYGLYALEPDGDKQAALFGRAVQNNVSGEAEPGVFKFIDTRLEAGTARLTPMYSLAGHEVLKHQILEEMKYRAPINYGLEIRDKFQKNGLASQLGQASRFAERADKVEKLLEERDEKLAQAWEAFTDLRDKAVNLHPFYKTNLRDLNELSERIGIHTIEEVRSTLKDAQDQVKKLRKEIRDINDDISNLRKVGTGAADSISRLIDSRNALQREVQEASKLITEYERLLQDLTRYAQLLAILKLKSDGDYTAVSTLNDSFQAAIKAVKKANDDLNAELSRSASSSGSSSNGLAAESVFAGVKVIDRQELDELESGVGGAVSLFSGVRAQLQDGLMFTRQKYTSTDSALDGFMQKLEQLYAKYRPLQTQREQQRNAVNAAKREQRNQAQPVLDQVRQGLGSCSIISGADPYESMYNKLQGDPAVAGNKGYYQAYIEHNQIAGAAQPVPVIDLKAADGAGLSAMKLVSALGDLVVDVRDEFYVDEYAVSKFSYRTLEMEKDAFGNVKTSKELSNPEQHALTNQEVEYLLYGSHSCIGNYSMAYAEMFAFRLAVGVTEALLKPQNGALAAGSPMLVLLAAVTEGAVRAGQDLTKLVQGEQVPLSRSFGSVVTLSYKDYLRLFLLLHSREAVLLSRMQALIQLNTGADLAQTPTYTAGTATTSFRLWFLPGVMRAIGKSGFSGCEGSGDRCRITKTAHLNY